MFTSTVIIEVDSEQRSGVLLTLDGQVTKSPLSRATAFSSAALPGIACFILH
jgi:hypothetical protein